MWKYYIGKFDNINFDYPEGIEFYYKGKTFASEYNHKHKNFNGFINSTEIRNLRIEINFDWAEILPGPPPFEIMLLEKMAGVYHTDIGIQLVEYDEQIAKSLKECFITENPIGGEIHKWQVEITFRDSKIKNLKPYLEFPNKKYCHFDDNSKFHTHMKKFVGVIKNTPVVVQIKSEENEDIIVADIISLQEVEKEDFIYLLSGDCLGTYKIL